MALNSMPMTIDEVFSFTYFISITTMAADLKLLACIVFRYYCLSYESICAYNINISYFVWLAHFFIIVCFFFILFTLSNEWTWSSCQWINKICLFIVFISIYKLYSSGYLMVLLLLWLFRYWMKFWIYCFVHIYLNFVNNVQVIWKWKVYRKHKNASWCFHFIIINYYENII